MLLNCNCAKLISDIAIFVLKSDVKLQLTNCAKLANFEHFKTRSGAVFCGHSAYVYHTADTVPLYATILRIFIILCCTLLDDRLSGIRPKITKNRSLQRRSSHPIAEHGIQVTEPNTLK